MLSVSLVYTFFSWSNSFILLLAQCLLIQELLVRCLFFRNENQEYSRRLVSTTGVKILRSKVGDFWLVIGIFSGPFVIGAIGLFTLSEFINVSFNPIESIHLVVALAFLVDPIFTLFLEHQIGDSLTAALGYGAIILIALGSVPGIDDLFSQILLVLALVNARFAFYDHFCLKNNIDLTFLAPGLFALFVALLPNISQITSNLRGV